MEDSVNGIFFDSGLDDQASVHNGLLKYSPALGEFAAVANVIGNLESYTWTIRFQNFLTYEDAIGDGRRMHFGLYSSTENILSNLHPTSSTAQVRLLSTNPPTDQVLVRGFTTQNDSAVLLDSSLTDFELSFDIAENDYEVKLFDNGISTTLFSGSDTQLDDIMSIQHFILSGTAFNGGFIEGTLYIADQCKNTDLASQMLIVMNFY